MDLDELKTFLEIIDTGSLVGASRRLHVTPSTVTARLAALETSVGHRLLHRSKSGVELTSAGFTLQRYAELMVQLSRQAAHALTQPDGAAGTCNVGLAADLWRGFGDRFLAAVERYAPEVAIALWPGEHRQLQRWLEIGLVDLAFDYLPYANEGYTSRVAFEDALVRVSAQPPGQGSLDLRYDIYVDHGDEFRRRHAEAFPQAPPPRVTLASSEWALEYLLRDDSAACGYLPYRHVASALAHGRLHRVTAAPVFYRQVHLIENPQAVKRWPWYAAAIAASVPTGSVL